MAAFTSVKSGDWNDGDTWGHDSPGVKGTDWPGNAGDTFTIANGHTVVYNVSEENALGTSTIAAGGVLSFLATANTKLCFGQNVLTVSGALRIGTSSVPIDKAYVAELWFATTGDNGGGIWVPNTAGAEITIYGDSTYYGGDEETYMDGDSDGDTSITTVDDMSAKWNIGDEIAIHKNIAYSAYNTDVLLTTISSITGTTIVCADSVSTAFKSKGIIVNLTRNVKIGKSGYNTAIGQFNTNRPYVSIQQGNNALVDINHASFGGLYEFHTGPDASSGRTWNRITNCVIRNCTNGLNTTYNSTIIGGVFFSVTTPVNYSYDATFNGTKFVAISGCIYGIKMSLLQNCIFAANAYYHTGSVGSRFEACIASGINQAFQDNYSCTYRDGNIYHCNTVFPASAKCYDIEFTDVAFEKDQWGTSHGSTSEFNLSLIDVRTVNCSFGGNSITYSARNNLTVQGRVTHEHYLGTLDAHKIDYNKCEITKVDADGGSDRPSARTGGNTTLQEISAQSNIGKTVMADGKSYPRCRLFEYEIQCSADVARTFKVYVQTTYVSLSVAGLWLDAEYLDTSDIAHSLSSSTIATRASASDWSQYLQVSVTPKRTGTLRLSCWVASYESTKKIWVDPLPEVS